MRKKLVSPCELMPWWGVHQTFLQTSSQEPLSQFQPNLEKFDKSSKIWPECIDIGHGASLGPGDLSLFK